MYGAEGCARNVVAPQFLEQQVSVYPFRRESAERQVVAYADVEIARKLAAYAGRRIVHRRLRIRDVRRGKHPRQTGIHIEHIPGPALHWNDFQFAVQMLRVTLLPPVHPLSVYHKGEFPDREAIYIRHRVLADEGKVARFHEVAFYLVASQRIGTVKHDHGYALLGTGPHHQAQGADEGI